MRYSSPLDSLLQFQKALERSMNSEWFGNTTSHRGGYPPINVFQDGDDMFIVSAELPGCKKSDIQIDIHKKRLRIHGEKKLSIAEGSSIHRRERSKGSFDRTVALPFEVDVDQVVAEFQNGVLSLQLPRAESEKPRAIQIA